MYSGIFALLVKCKLLYYMPTMICSSIYHYLKQYTFSWIIGNSQNSISMCIIFQQGGSKFMLTDPYLSTCVGLG